MSLWQRFTRLFDGHTQTGISTPLAPQSHLEAVTWAHLLDLDSIPIDRTQALAIPAVAKAVGLITSTIGRLPIVAMKNARAVDVQPAWVDQPEPGHPRFITMAATVENLVMYGRAWWLIESRYATGYPAQFVLAPESVMSTDSHGKPMVNGEYLDPRDVVRIDAPHDGLLTFGRATLNKAKALSEASLRAANNPVPSIDLHHTDNRVQLSQDDIRALVKSWQDARKGPNGGVAYTNSAIEARVLGQPVEQLLIEANNQTALDVARLLGLPAWSVDAEISGSSLTYSNSAARMRELIDFGLAPYISAIESRLSCADVSPAGWRIRLDPQQITRDDLATRMQAYKIALESGVYTLDQIRDIETGQPLEMGDHEN
ncbi:phage portal protein [Brevibacterium sp. UMB10442]|nr:phage portal protein [Brevibacterium sp. UMB10442]